MIKLFIGIIGFIIDGVTNGGYEPWLSEQEDLERENKKLLREYWKCVGINKLNQELGSYDKLNNDRIKGILKKVVYNNDKIKRLKKY